MSDPTRYPRAANTVLRRVYNQEEDALNVNIVDTIRASTPSAGFPKTVQIDNNSAELLAANPDRKFAIIANNQGFTAYLAFGADAVIQEGVPLKPNDMIRIDSNFLWRGTVNAIKAGANSAPLDVWEA